MVGESGEERELKEGIAREGNGEVRVMERAKGRRWEMKMGL